MQRRGILENIYKKKRIFNIKELAERYKCTDGEILEVLFCYERNKQEHTPKEKCRLELLEQI